MNNRTPFDFIDPFPITNGKGTMGKKNINVSDLLPRCCDCGRKIRDRSSNICRECLAKALAKAEPAKEKEKEQNA